MTSPSPNVKKPPSWPLLATNLLFLSGCAAGPTIVRACPPPIPITVGVIDGYAACPANPALDDYMDKIERQQELLATP